MLNSMNDKVPFPKETSFLREKKKGLRKVTEEIKPVTIKHHLVHSVGQNQYVC